MPTGTACFALLLICSHALVAQTQDQARLIMGISVGRVGAVPLYDLPDQPILSPPLAPTTYHLYREFRENITVSGHLTYFRTPRLGVSLEFTYLGVGTRDRCTVTHDGGDFDLVEACAALDGNLRSPATSQVQAGLQFRPLPESLLQPYFKAEGGIAFTPNSTTYTVAEYPGVNGQHQLLTVYPEDPSNSIRPAWTAAVGISTAPHTGYQFRLEVRESWMQLNTITGPTANQGAEPGIKGVVKGFTSIVLGFDVVLAKQRGRRY